MKKMLLCVAVLALAALPAMPQARWGPSDVYVTTPMGEALQVMKQRYPKNQVKQDDGEQTLTHAYRSGGKLITVKTTRFRFNDHGAWEAKGSWLDRHAKAIAEMQKALPPDPPSVGGGGDVVGSLPAPEHAGACPPGGSLASEWLSEIPSQPGAFYTVRHHIHQATLPALEPYEVFQARFLDGETGATALWPLP